MDRAAYASLPPEAVMWLANGARGISSNTFFSVMYGIDALGPGRYRDAPHDPSDLNRCRLMVESIPGGRERLLSIADVKAPMRTRIALMLTVQNWDVLCGVMDAELNAHRSGKPVAHRLYDAMQLLVWNEAESRLRDIPTDIKRGEHGTDRLVQRSPNQLPSANYISGRIGVLLAMPDSDTDLPGREAAALLVEANVALKHLVTVGGDVGEKAAKVLEERAYVAAVPRNQKQEDETRRALHAALMLLWREGLFEPRGSALAASAYKELSAKFDAAVEKARTAMSQPAAPALPAAPRRPRAAA